MAVQPTPHGPPASGQVLRVRGSSPFNRGGVPVLKQVAAVAVLLAIAMGIAWAGDMAKPAAGQMEAMKAAMSKCDVCKIMVPKMDELAPMKMEVVKLNEASR
jgi:hypothetical protein